MIPSAQWDLGLAYKRERIESHEMKRPMNKTVSGDHSKFTTVPIVSTNQSPALTLTHVLSLRPCVLQETALQENGPLQFCRHVLSLRGPRPFLNQTVLILDDVVWGSRTKDGHNEWPSGTDSIHVANLSRMFHPHGLPRDAVYRQGSPFCLIVELR